MKNVCTQYAIFVKKHVKSNVYKMPVIYTIKLNFKKMVKRALKIIRLDQNIIVSNVKKIIFMIKEHIIVKNAIKTYVNFA